MILCPFDDAKVSRIYGDWMVLRVAVLWFLVISRHIL